MMFLPIYLSKSTYILSYQFNVNSFKYILKLLLAFFYMLKIHFKFNQIYIYIKKIVNLLYQ